MPSSSASEDNGLSAFAWDRSIAPILGMSLALRGWRAGIVRAIRHDVVTLERGVPKMPRSPR